jgi:MerR family mercuric resistance operon transcriptional regulator
LARRGSDEHDDHRQARQQGRRRRRDDQVLRAAGADSRASAEELRLSGVHRRGVHRIRFIRRAKELGFTLREIDELLSLRVDPTTTCSDLKQRAERKIHDIDEKLQMLGRMKAALQRLVAECRDRGPSSECPILEALEDPSS